jgi:hypothetical protein
MQSKAFIADVMQLYKDYLHREGLPCYSDIAKRINHKYKMKLSTEAVRHYVRKYRNIFDMTDDEAAIRALRDVARTKRASSKTARENRVILDHLNAQKDFEEQVKELIKELNKRKPIKISIPKRKNKRHYTAEMMLSDLHPYNRTAETDETGLRSRIKKYTEAVIKDLKRKAQFYTLDEIVLALLGDMLTNSDFHGMESMAGSIEQSPEQARWIIEVIFTEVIEPLAGIGVPIIVKAVVGNHDRTREQKTYVNPGKNSWTWVIYHTLKMLTEVAGYKHVTWDIPEKSFTTYEIYGTLVAYEHADSVRSITKKGFSDRINDITAQLGRVVHCYRGGHWHEHTEFDAGRIIINGSVCGQDGYSEERGFNSNPGQVVNYYIPTDRRPTSFYHSFLVQLQ